MGLVTAELTLRNPLDDRLEPSGARALMETGAPMRCIPEHVATQLQLQPIQVREVTTAEAIPMQDLDAVITHSRKTIDVNPESPNMPRAIVKSAHCLVR